MLKPGTQPPAAATLGALEARVLELVAETAGVAPDEICAGAPLAATLDSLTLAAVVARAEAALGFELGGGERVAVLSARDIGELCRLIAVAAAHSLANLPKEPRNAGCPASRRALE